jgi:hypothetical protein
VSAAAGEGFLFEPRRTGEAAASISLRVAAAPANLAVAATAFTEGLAHIARHVIDTHFKLLFLEWGGI